MISIDRLYRLEYGAKPKFRGLRAQSALIGDKHITHLEIGDPAPAFKLDTDGREPLQVPGGSAAPMVLFFYPQDDTEGCTMEARDFSALVPRFRKLGASVAGISPDSVASHRAFRKRHGLKCMLGADPDHVAIGAYGIWGPKSTFGRDYMGLIRTTFLVAGDGTIARTWTVRRIKGHAAEVLAATEALPGSGTRSA